MKAGFCSTQKRNEDESSRKAQCYILTNLDSDNCERHARRTSPLGKPYTDDSKSLDCIGMTANSGALAVDLPPPPISALSSLTHKVLVK